ncbi:hypothetical protein AvCA_32020 [Azotobacter vinelandii CA]|uniref:Uncharacterized protein n=2 Tax=Azotobacter vinelandii TaxID=354 RepID=C1DP12_AZOVD|nr:hypothetical protein [Azotobacter vinelandii]ACO79365.1 conserved hypothetical protein [Azotobacter vinelandii DJ]AGK16417.1 hypothetical protein AvCA_32020 [Azotobacter vinelandii CA]AGK21159.1 hypothetical protein AvCA6_32020 [Azotobacter vinelandii CA6]SFY10394.1 hypothetical protein SAMN04244547_03998 [Azotobacter vinelandii]GLK60420.1 hypothetical protein GCM10017624_25800 [Azotobacter vinelandii]
MSLNLDVIIDTPEQSVDMKAGLDTLQGTSDAIRTIGETVLSEKISERLSHKGKVRTTLKKSFKGSYGHTFSLDIHDEELKRKFNSIGKTVFSELISYFISESLYKESEQLSAKAQKIVDNLGDTIEGLVKQLRKSPLNNVHEVSTKFNYDVKLRFRKSASEQVVISHFDKHAAEVLQAKEDKQKIDIIASIARLNINTGNGRLLLKDADETVAFGFGVGYRDVNMEAKNYFQKT